MVMKQKGYQIVLNIIMVVLSLFCLIPLLLIVSSSLSAENSLLRQGYSVFVQDFSFAAYEYLLVNSDNIVRGYGMSFLVTVLGTMGGLTITTLFAYPLARKDLPGRTLFSFMLFFTMLFNGGLVPSYIMWTQTFHIKNTLFAYLLPNLFMNSFFVIMMRTYITNSIPDAVIEAARIDGAGEMRTLVQVVLPMSLPIIATLALLIGLGYWNDWLNGLYYVSSDKMYSIQVVLNKMLLDALFTFSGQASKMNMTSTGTVTPTTSIKMAVAVLGALPILIIYPFFQKYFVKGITIGAVKG